MPVSVKTSNIGEDNEAVAKLGLQDEVDRLSNYSLLKQSVIRDNLKAMKAEIRLWFRESESMAKKWAIDHGVITAVVSGHKTEWNLSSLAPEYRGEGS
jgi:hypothetical protein